MSIGIKKSFQQNPNLKINLSKRMKEKNPTKNPLIVQKIKAHWKEFGHPLSRNKFKGGNGKVMPKNQRILWAALGPDWKPEFPIKTKQKRNSEYPPAYKVDLALPEYKIWIEIDGWSHSMPSRILEDQKKEQFLKTLGWDGLRFSNENISENLKTVLSAIHSFLKSKNINCRIN